MPNNQQQTEVNVGVGAGPVAVPRHGSSPLGSLLFWLFLGGFGAQDAGAQEVYNPPRDYAVREIADRTFPPACAARGCGRQRFSVTITTTETDSVRMEWAMKDAVFYDTPDRAHAVLVYLVDTWPGGETMAVGDYSADGCGWAGSRDGSGCGGPKWEMQWLHPARYVNDEPESGVVAIQGAGQGGELVGYLVKPAPNFSPCPA